MDIVAELPAETSGPLVQLRRIVEDLAVSIGETDGALRGLLAEWGIPQRREAGRVPLGWMGHLVSGQTPGAIPEDMGLELAGLGDEARLARVAELLSGHIQGAVLMGRGVLEFSADKALNGLVTTMIQNRSVLLAELEEWFLSREQLPPTWIAPMTTDPGELDHGDPVGSLESVLGEARRWVLVAVGTAAIVGAFVRPAQRWSPIGAGIGLMSGLAGLGHLAVVAPHLLDSVAAGIFFVSAGVLQIALGAVVARRPSPSTLNLAATVAAAMTVIYSLFRVIPPPGSIGPADVDLPGLVIVVFQCAVVAAWALRPFGGPALNWGLDDIASAVTRGIAGATLIGLVAIGGIIGYLVGETDSRPPSEIDVGFATDMIRHHNQAVEIALRSLDRLEDPTARSVAQEVLLAQRYEIGILQTRLDEWGVTLNGDDDAMGWMGMQMPLDEMPGIASNAQISYLDQATGTTLDEAFFAVLATHHVGGVQMAEFAAAYADDGSIRDLARIIARNQRFEIAEYQQTMERAGYEVPSGSLKMPRLAAYTVLAAS